MHLSIFLRVRGYVQDDGGMDGELFLWNQQVTGPDMFQVGRYWIVPVRNIGII